MRDAAVGQTAAESRAANALMDGELDQLQLVRAMRGNRGRAHDLVVPKCDEDRATRVEDRSHRVGELPLIGRLVEEMLVEPRTVQRVPRAGVLGTKGNDLVRHAQSWGGRTRTCNFPGNSRAVCQLTYTPRETKKTRRRRVGGRGVAVLPLRARASRLSGRRDDFDCSRARDASAEAWMEAMPLRPARQGRSQLDVAAAPLALGPREVAAIMPSARLLPPQRRL